MGVKRVASRPAAEKSTVQSTCKLGGGGQHRARFESGAVRGIRNSANGWLHSIITSRRLLLFGRWQNRSRRGSLSQRRAAIRARERIARDRVFASGTSCHNTSAAQAQLEQAHSNTARVCRGNVVGSSEVMAGERRSRNTWPLSMIRVSREARRQRHASADVWSLDTNRGWSTRGKRHGRRRLAEPLA